MEKSPQGLNPIQKTTGNKEKLGTGGGSPQGRIDQLVNLENMHTISIIWSEQVILTTMSSLVESKRSAI